MKSAVITVGLSVAVLVSFRVLADESVHKPLEGPSIGTLLEQDVKSLPYMCECEFFRGPINGETMVFATRNERAVGFAVVDERLITFQRDGQPANSLCRKKVRYHERWVSGTTAIILDQHVTGSGAEACWYKGKMSVTIGRRTVSAPISGACGC